MGVIDDLKDKSDKDFKDIPLGALREDSITDAIETEILRSQQMPTSVIRYEMGADYKESKTAADFVLVLKGKDSRVHWLAFQAKKGFEPDNKYKEIIHQIGKSDTYQIEKFMEWVEKNSDKQVEGYYLFYNGRYSGNEPINTSYFVENVKSVILKVRIGKMDFQAIKLEDVVNSHVKFTDLLEDLVK